MIPMKIFIAKLYTVQMIAIIPMHACFQKEGIWTISSTIENPVVETEADFIDPSIHKPPDADHENKVGMTFLIERELNGAIDRADIIEKSHKNTSEREKSLASHVDGKHH